MSDLSDFDLDLAECLQNCPELDGPLLNDTALNDLCLSDELWTTFDLSGINSSTDVTDLLHGSQISEDVLGLATPPQSPDKSPPPSTHHQTTTPHTLTANTDINSLSESTCNITTSPSPPVTTRALHVLKSGEVVCIQVPMVNSTSGLTTCTSNKLTGAMCPNDTPVSSIKQEVVTVGKRAARPALDTSDMPSAKLSKKQQRMIKNRESACISRQKKKEYVQCMEKKLQEAAVKNSALLRENASLRSQISELEKENGTLRSRYHISLPSLQKPTMVLLVVLCFAVVMFPKDMVNFPFIHHSNPTTALATVSTVKGRALLSVPVEEEQPQSHALIPVSTALSNIMMRLSNKQSTGSSGEQKHGSPGIAPKVCSCPPLNVSKHNHTAMKMLSYKLSESFKAEQDGFKPMYYDTQDVRNTNSLVLVPTTDSIVHVPFKKLFRRDQDSFYVISFKDHRLLNAPSHNVTNRPRMSILVPNSRSSESLTGYNVMPMLQISCDVTDAEVVHMDVSKLV